MASAQAKTVKRLSKKSESHNGWSGYFADCNTPVENQGSEAGQRALDRIIRHALKQPPTYRGWPNLMVRFWACVEKTDTCWFWRGGICNGYGQIAVGSSPALRFRSHRLSWIWHFGDIPAGKEVAHTCNQPACVRPAHLELLTHHENMRYAGQQGRMRGPHKPKSEHVSPPKGARGGNVRARLGMKVN